ncbi:L-asparaginase precursor [Xylariomycetidae sp. FL0641]|nr:L-asparaginase precursor [Xylariomycetidae sp. FL0641]
MYTKDPATDGKVKPRLIIHGGAGNIRKETMPPELYAEYRKALLTIVTETDRYMRTPPEPPQRRALPTALDAATYAVEQLEENPLFNSGHGAVFTRDGVNELEASVMVSRGRAKRGVGVTGLRHVRSPVRLAKRMLEHGDADLSAAAAAGAGADGAAPDVPSAQGHTLLHGAAAEALAARYGLRMVPATYFYTRRRWEEHVRGLEREKRRGARVGTAHWSPDEYLPQGTCGAVALDADGVVCVATSTGGLTNKLTGRIGDTPVVGAGFWAEEWTESGVPSVPGPARDPWARLREHLQLPGPVVELSANLRGLLAECFPTPFMYEPVGVSNRREVHTTRSMAMSGTGNGDSFLRTAAARSVASIARWGRLPGPSAMHQIAGRGGELQKSAGGRWGKTGEGEGGMIGIECAVTRDNAGCVLHTTSQVLQDHNCAGMFRAWIDEDGSAVMRIWDTSGDGQDWASAVEVLLEKFEY